MRSTAIIILLSLFVISTPVFAEIPHLINYQGVLTDNSGNLVNDKYIITFSIYADSLGKSPLWEETQAVIVEEGLFHVLLGSIKGMPDSIFNNNKRFLGLRIDNDEELLPRRRLASVAYSFHSSNSDKLNGRNSNEFIFKGEKNSISIEMIPENTITTEKIIPSIVSSINGIVNDGGDIQILGEGNISISSDNNNKKLIITTTGLGNGDITGVTAGNGLTGGGVVGDVTINIGTGEGINSTADQISLNTTYTDARYINVNETNSISNGMVQNNAITTEKITPNIVSSVDGVVNDGGNIDLVAGSNINISSDDVNNRITISATGVGTGDITAVNSGEGLTGGGSTGDVTLNIGAGTGIDVLADQISLNTGYTDGRYVNVGESNSITSAMITDGTVTNNDILNNTITDAKISTNIVSSVDGVTNDGGNIDFVASGNINITPDDTGNRITFSVTSSGDITSVNAGNGLSGGGTSGDVTLNVGAGNGINVSSDIVSINTTYTDGLYVNEGQSNAVTTSMISDGTITNNDISNSANISPTKISGTAWTASNDGAGSGMDADLIDGQHASSFLSTSNDYGRSGVSTTLYEGTQSLTDRYVNEGQSNCITSTMMVDGTITNSDISNSAAISPSKISGTAWTSTNDGASSGLDADLLDGQHASSFLSTSNDYGRSGVATTLYEGTQSLTDRYVNEGQNNSIINTMLQANSVTVDKISPNVVSSIEGVSNDGGNIDLVPGSNITITPDDANNRITISASGGTGDITSVIAGDGLIGGATTGDATIHVRTGTGLYVSADDINLNTTYTDNRYVNVDEGSSVTSAMITNGTITGLDINTSTDVSIHNLTASLNINASNLISSGNILASNAIYTLPVPSSSFNSGDIVATDDIIADDGVFANGQINCYGYGIYSQNNHSGYGVRGEGYYGIYGLSSTYAGYFQGPVTVTGWLTKPIGSFKIDHPLDPANKYLYHSFVESPDMMNIYNGIAILNDNGDATVDLPEWFEALNKDFRYQLTCIGGFAPVYIAQEISNNRFTIAGGKSGMKVSWLVTGIRQDKYANAHRIPVEEDKPMEERGTYLYPKEHNVSETLGINYKKAKEMEETRNNAQQ